jgi:hypothetical protein
MITITWPENNHQFAITKKEEETEADQKTKAGDKAI